MAVYGNLPNIKTTLNEKYFNNYYSEKINISAGVNDSVVAFFQSITGNRDTGLNLAAAVIYTASQQNIDPVEIVNMLEKKRKKNLQQQPEFYEGQTNQTNQDTYVYNEQTGTWSTGTSKVKPGPSAPYNQLNEIDAYLTMFLNLNRVGTSLLGISNSPQTSFYVKRLILA